jgi:hypothetical protein
MPCEYAGFTLKPFGFFGRNPGIDLARSGSAHGGHCVSGKHGFLVSAGLLVSTGMPGKAGMAEGTGLTGSPACT